MRRYALAGFAVLGLVAAAPASQAVPVIESADHGRLEVNWGSLRVRYYGEATVEGEGETGFKNAEKQAWRDGLNYGSDAARSLNLAMSQALVGVTQDKLPQEVKHAASALMSSSSSYNTAYFADGKIRVHLEGPLAKVYTTSLVHFRQKEATESAATEVTGIVLQTSEAIKPTPMYQIVDEQQNVLFEASDMAQAAYQKGLMGRWFHRPTDAELESSVGAHPVTLAATPTTGRFSVKRADWDKAMEGHRSLLVNGTIAIAMP